MRQGLKPKEHPLKKALDALYKELKKNPAYFTAWQTNIALTMYNNYVKNGFANVYSEEGLIALQNCFTEGSKIFLNELLDIK